MYLHLELLLLVNPHALVTVSALENLAMEKVKQAQSSLVVFDHQVNCGSVSQHEAHTLPGIEFFVRIHFFLDLMSEIVGAECALCNNLILTTWKNRFPEL